MGIYQKEKTIWINDTYFLDLISDVPGNETFSKINFICRCGVNCQDKSLDKYYYYILQGGWEIVDYNCSCSLTCFYNRMITDEIIISKTNLQKDNII